MKYIKKVGLLLLVTFMWSSCGEDFMDTEYTTYLESETASELIETDPGALNAYLLGAFSYLVQSNVTGNGTHDDFSHMSVLHSTDMMGQDIVMSALHWFNYDYLHDNVEFNYRRTSIDWLTYYTIVAKANEILNLFAEDPTTPEAKGVLAHGYALRGFAYYYLIQLYQHPVTSSGDVNLSAPGVPMVFSLRDGLSEEEKLVKKGRNTLAEVYSQIESDLTTAVELFEAGYIRPNKNYLDASVANGLLARYYLLSQQWDKAAAASKKAYADYSLNQDEKGINDGFTDIENSEWMWGFDHNTETQTTYASFFSHISNLTPGYAGLNYAARLIDASLYEKIPSSDVRKKWFNGADGDPEQEQPGARRPYANVKFGWINGWIMDYMYMRVPEMYLIEAEALAHMGNNAGAANALRPLMETRDPNWEQTEMTVDEIWIQRRIELWGEGFSYFDHKRLSKPMVRNYSGSNHLSSAKFNKQPLDRSWIYRIPRQEMQENKQLTEADQNQ